MLPWYLNFSLLLSLLDIHFLLLVILYGSHYYSIDIHVPFFTLFVRTEHASEAMNERAKIMYGLLLTMTKEGSTRNYLQLPVTSCNVTFNYVFTNKDLKVFMLLLLLRCAACGM